MAIGTAGVHIPVLSDASGRWTMLGKEVIFTEKTAALGTVGDLMLVDPTEYCVGIRSGIALEKSGHLGFQTDTSHVRAIIRLDGQPKSGSVVTPRTGDTTSPFVALQTRS